MPVNTTTGPKEDNRDRPAHVVNTSHAVEEELTYLDEEPEILAIFPSAGWFAVLEGNAIPLVAWVALDTGKLYGVVVGEDGCVDLTEGNVELLTGFAGYKQDNSDDKEG